MSTHTDSSGKGWIGCASLVYFGSVKGRDHHEAVFACLVGDVSLAAHGMRQGKNEQCRSRYPCTKTTQKMTWWMMQLPVVFSEIAFAMWYEVEDLGRRRIGRIVACAAVQPVPGTYLGFFMGIARLCATPTVLVTNDGR